MQPYEMKAQPIVDRFDAICASARNRRVLHVGCADVPFSQAHHSEGRLLHARLATVAESIIGVDLDAQGVKFMNGLGYEGVFCASVEDLEILNGLDRFDLIVAGEIIEHLPNPGRGLSEMRRFLRPNGRIIVTVPNAFAVKGMLRVLAGTEMVHPDHVFYFSPRTISRLLSISGYEVTSVQYYASKPTRMIRKVVHGFIYGAIRWYAPWLADGLVVEAILNGANREYANRPS